MRRNRLTRLFSVFVLTAGVVSAMFFDAEKAVSQERVKAQDSISRIAPPTCLFYTEWQPAPKAGAESISETEKLLKEEEVQRFIEHLRNAATDTLMFALDENDLAVRRSIRILVNDVVDSVTRNSGSFYLENIGMDLINQKYRLDGVFAFELKGDKEPYRDVIAATLKRNDAPFKTVEIEGFNFIETNWPEEAAISSKLYFGGTPDHWLIVSGKSALRNCLKRLAKNDVPSWLTDIQKRQPVSRSFSLTFVDLKRIRDQYLPLAGEEIVGIVNTLGFGSLQSLESVGGYDRKGMVTRTSLQFDGQPTGLLQLLDGRPVNGKLLGQMPADSFIAGAMTIDPDSMMKMFRQMVAGIGPRAEQEFERSLKMFQVDYGFSLEDDLLANIGPTVLLANGAGDGWLTGLTLRIEVSDQKKVESSLAKLINVFVAQAWSLDLEIGLETEVFRDHTIRFARVKNGPFPFEPAWCFVDDQLVFALTRSTLRPLIEKNKADKKLDMAELLLDQGTRDDKLLAALYVDDRRQFEFVYPYLLLMKSMMPQLLGVMDSDTPEFDSFASGIASIPLPSARSIYRHLHPSIVNVYRTDSGVDVVTRQTIPTPNVVVASPIGVALLLPAVQSARMAARQTQSMNNMKMQMLAAHNFHDVMKRFPAGYSIDKNGKPLLSWRVHLLPYIEQNALYDEFHLDEPWDSDHNRKLIKRMPFVFRSPVSEAEEGKTVYRAIGGYKGVFRASLRPGAHTGTKFAQILDGSSYTIAIIETSDALATEWTKPETLVPGKFDYSDLFGNYPRGTNAAYADGSVRFVSDAATPKMLTYLFDRSDAEVVDLESEAELLERQRRVDPDKYRARVEKELKELEPIQKLEIRLVELNIELQVTRMQMEQARTDRATASSKGRRLQDALKSLEKQQKEKPSAELVRKIQLVKSELQGEQKKLSEFSKSLFKLEAKMDEMVDELRDTDKKYYESLR